MAIRAPDGANKNGRLLLTGLSMSLKRKYFHESLIKGEDPERQDIEQQNSSHQALQGETPLISPPAPG